MSMPDRRFLAICTLSLALHALVLAFAAWQRPSAPAQLPPILASLRLIPISEPGPAAPAARPPAASTVSAASVAAAAVPTKARPRLTSAAPPSAPREADAVGPALAPATVAVNAAPQAAPALAAAPAAEPAPARPQAELLAGYRQRLAELFAAQQEYPRLAAMRGWEGEVRLRLKVARKGNLLDVQLDRSSGFDVLDRHALAMLDRFASLPPLPEALEASEILVIVPIHYKLKKTT